jgi:uncharacterized Fe-S center protein
MVAVKLHVGEKNNNTYVRPELVAAVVDLIKKARGQAFLTDTSTLYKGERENAIKHALHAHAHGFGVDNTGAPFIALDGLSGTEEAEVVVDGELNKTVKIAGQILFADALAVVTHATGHMGTGLGGAIKNVGMGLSSRAGKMRQHSTIMPEVIPDKCENCGKCRRWCPADAIDEREGASYIVKEKCIGCGECLAVCRYGAVKYDFMIKSPIVQKSMAEHAAGVIRNFGEKAVFINVLIDMTTDCDCINRKQKKAAPDLGVLASTDIVAVDQATLDITQSEHGEDISAMSYPRLKPVIQIEHAEKMGMGKREYELKEL